MSARTSASLPSISRSVSATVRSGRERGGRSTLGSGPTVKARLALLAVVRMRSCISAGVSASRCTSETVRDRICSRLADCTAERRSSTSSSVVMAWPAISAPSRRAISWPARLRG
ncbi:hypothetical protein A6302_03895 [Methylobrevis pamukkalensis]|uniref:Uncharacterized protein n=1 Tax=Methylobrevis pamukkalensis TaxID=1439726 RepID=A0A1E3GXQ4_9HYPH|nr:hypothetical protein A6302_03895 [Methylobrevis pamukkalensis]